MKVILELESQQFETLKKILEEVIETVMTKHMRKHHAVRPS